MTDRKRFVLTLRDAGDERDVYPRLRRLLKYALRATDFVNVRLVEEKPDDDPEEPAKSH